MNNSSKFGNENSGFSNSNEINPSFSFNSSSIPLSGSGLTKPRIAKTRRQTGTNNPRTSSLNVPDMMVHPSYNPFKPNLSNFDSVPSRAEIGEKNGAFTFGANTSVSNANLNNGLSGNAVKDVIFEMGELSTGVGVNRSDPNVGCSGSAETDVIDKLGGLNIASEVSFTDAKNSGFVFKGASKKSSSSDEIKVSDDMSKLSIGHLGSDEYNRNNKDAPGARIGGMNDNVASSFWKNVDSEFPNEFNKLNVKKTPVSSETLLPDHMSNLNLKDHVGLNRVEKNVGYKNTKDDSKLIFGNGTIRSDNMGDDTNKVLLDKLGNMKIESVGRDSSIKTDKGFTSHDAFMNKQKTGNLNNKMFQNVGESAPTGFTFNTAMHVKSSGSISEPSINISGKKDEFPFTTTETPHVVFNTPNSKGKLFSNLNQKPEFNIRRVTDNNRLKKGRGKLNKQHDPVQVWLGPYSVTGESSFQENSLSPASYSPMDVSPYEETLADNRSRRSYVGSDDSFHVDESNDSLSTVSNDAMDEDLAFATQRMNISEINEKSEEKEHEFYRGVSTENDIEESMPGADTESFVTAAEELDCSSESFDNEVNSRSDDSVQFFSTNSQVGAGENFIFGSSSTAQGQSSAVARPYGKKNRPKFGTDLSSSTIPSGNVLYASSNVQFPLSESPSLSSPRHSQTSPSLSSPRHSQTADIPALQRREQQLKMVTTSTSGASVAAQEACEKWRLRGNQSYLNGDLTKSESLYTLGVNCVSQNETSRSCLRALMLCYSNRAATRMALGRFKEAIEDCKLAAGIDPNFLKVQLRSANCYLALGEVAEALQCFRKCLQPGNEVSVDRKTMIEASEGLEKAQKVSEYINQSTELIRRRTTIDTESALNIIAEALLISSHSEILLEMKAEALFQLRKHEEVIQLCEESLVLAKMDFPPSGGDGHSANPDSSALLKNFSSKPWRFNLILKSYFYLGKLEEALDFLEKQDGLRDGSKALESSIPLAVIRELLGHKAAGNEAFQSGRHAEAIEHYTAALSCNVESRPFAAICFCNRGAANKNLGQITDAIADCSLAIALDRKYLKALSRRASLYETIRDYGQAANDLQRLVSILSEQVEGLEAKTNQSGAAYRSTTNANDLREAQFRLSEMEGESRKEIPLNMYLILGIEPSVSASEIKKAYRKAALRHHPDKAVQSLARSDNGDDWLWKEIAEEVHKDADRLFKMIGEAYAVLSNPSKRSRYDLEEEMRTARSNVSRTHADTQSYPFDPRSTSRRHWTEVRKSYWHS